MYNEITYFDLKSASHRLERKANKFNQFIRGFIGVTLGVLALVMVASLLINMSVESTKLHNLKTYGNENGFQAVQH